VCGLFCNGCGHSIADGEINCSACGAVLQLEPHISSVTSGEVAFCEICRAMNIRGANFCRVCGRRFTAVSLHPTPIPAFVGAYAEITPETTGFEGKQAAFMAVPEKPESLLEKLDRMERELENRQGEILPEAEQDYSGNDQLNAHEETLKNIAFTLDSLIADLLEAEVREYAFPEFIHPDETGFPLKEAHVSRVMGNEKKSRSIQEIVVIIALVAAIFLVGMTFGLWGSFFLGF
jgi:hypothetical protein